jgi:putative phosphoesterase
VVSDTHGSLDPRLLQEFSGVSLIVHAGDIERPSDGIIEELEALAPVRAVEGNTDSFPPGLLPVEARLEVAGVRFYVRHDLGALRRDSVDDADVVVAGHTHRPDIRQVDGALLVNPGSISRSRTSDGVNTAAIITLGPGGPSARILYFP